MANFNECEFQRCSDRLLETLETLSLTATDEWRFNHLLVVTIDFKEELGDPKGFFIYLDPASSERFLTAMEDGRNRGSASLLHRVTTENNSKEVSASNVHLLTPDLVAVWSLDPQVVKIDLYETDDADFLNLIPTSAIMKFRDTVGPMPKEFAPV